MKLTSKVFLLLISIFGLFVIFSAAQTSIGKLKGFVLDQNSGRIVGGKIYIESKGFKKELIADENGAFEIELPAGKYKIQAKMGGFFPSKRKTVHIKSNQVIHFDFKLQGIRNDSRHP